MNCVQANWTELVLFICDLQVHADDWANKCLFEWNERNWEKVENYIKNNHYWVFLLWLHFNLIFINSLSMAPAFFASSRYAAHCAQRQPSSFDPLPTPFGASTDTHPPNADDEDCLSRWLADTPDSLFSFRNAHRSRPRPLSQPRLVSPTMVWVSCNSCWFWKT